MFAFLQAELRHQPQPHPREPPGGEAGPGGRPGSYSVTRTITFTISGFSLIIKARLARARGPGSRPLRPAPSAERRLPPPEVPADDPDVSGFAGAGTGALLDSFPKAPLVWGREHRPGQPRGHRGRKGGNLGVGEDKLPILQMRTLRPRGALRLWSEPTRQLGLGLNPSLSLRSPCCWAGPCSALGWEATEGQAGSEASGRRPARRLVVRDSGGSGMRLLLRAGGGRPGTMKLLELRAKGPALTWAAWPGGGGCGGPPGVPREAP